MDFLADENVSRTLVKALRDDKYNVKDIKEEKLYGISDDKVLDLATRENRIVITHDKDFLNISRYIPVGHKGIIILKFYDQNPKSVSARFLSVLNSPVSEKFKNALVIISENHVEIIK